MSGQSRASYIVLDLFRRDLVNNMNSVAFFLGANTPTGFYSLFNELYKPEDKWKMYIIKGGPGTGKSSLMKFIASEADKRGYKTEQIFCSSDPSSLDALIIPDLNIAIADGTSPHIIEPVFPGVCENIVNLGECWNNTKLSENREKIIDITKENSRWHKQSVKYMSAAAIIDKEIYLNGKEILNKSKIERYMNRTCNQIMNKTDADSFSVKKRFLSAVTPMGISIMYDSLYKYCDNVIAVKDKLTVAADYIMKYIYNYCIKNEISIILCMCPMNPENKIDHIILPDIRTGFFTANKYHPLSKQVSKTVNCKRFYDTDEYDAIKNKITFLNKAKEELISESVLCLKNAKSTHDTLESYYIAAMNYNRVSEIRNNLVKEILNVSRETSDIV